MASNVKTLTEVDETREAQQLRLRLQSVRPPAKRARSSNLISGAYDWANSFVRGEPPELEQTSDPRATERNERKLREYFTNMRKKLNNPEEHAVQELRTMTHEQQRDVLTFWESASQFFSDVLDWLKEMFMAVCKKIRQCFRVVKSAIVNIFRQAKEMIRSFIDF